MRVRMRTTMAHPQHGTALAGKLANLPDDLAATLIEAGYAVAVPDAVPAAPPEAETADATPGGETAEAPPQASPPKRRGQRRK